MLSISRKCAALVESVRTQFLSLRHFYPVKRSPHADAGLKRQGTGRFWRKPLDRDAGKLGFKRSLSAIFLPGSGLQSFWYGWYRAVIKGNSQTR